jgi:hypothetical protein
VSLCALFYPTVQLLLGEPHSSQHCELHTIQGQFFDLTVCHCKQCLVGAATVRPVRALASSASTRWLGDGHPSLAPPENRQSWVTRIASDAWSDHGAFVQEASWSLGQSPPVPTNSKRKWAGRGTGAARREEAAQADRKEHRTTRGESGGEQNDSNTKERAPVLNSILFLQPRAPYFLSGLRIPCVAPAAETAAPPPCKHRSCSHPPPSRSAEEHTAATNKGELKRRTVHGGLWQEGRA